MDTSAVIPDPLPVQVIADPLPEDRPGFVRRLGQSFGIPTSMDELQAAGETMRPKSAGDWAGTAIAGPIYPAVKNYVSTAVRGIGEGAHEVGEAASNVVHGGPVLANSGKAAYGIAHGVLQAIPIMGPSIETAGEDVHDKNYSGAAGGLTGVAAQVLAPKIVGRLSEPVRGASALREVPTPRTLPASESGEALGTVPAVKPPIPVRPINVRGPGEVAPELVTRKAFYGGISPEPIPARGGLALPAAADISAPVISKPQPSVAPIRSALAPMPPSAAAESIPRTLPGESVLRQVLTGQDNANLLKIARSRGINVTAEAQLKPGVADNRIINKIIEDFSPDELEELRSKGLEVKRFRHNFGEIGPEAWKTMGMQTYFPDVKIPEAVLKRTQGAITRPATSPRPVIVPTPPTGDLMPMLKKSLRAVKARGINVAATGAND